MSTTATLHSTATPAAFARMGRASALALALAALTACPAVEPAHHSVDPGTPPPSVEVSPDLPAGTFVFGGDDVTLPNDDLAPLMASIGDASVIGLGESVHTSGGFYALKDRIIRALVDEHGVRAFAMETPRTQAETLDAYVQGGVCDESAATQALHSVFAVFVSDRTRDLFVYLCQRNAAHPNDRVRFFGFDMQQPDDDMHIITAGIEAHLPSDPAILELGLHTCVSGSSTTTSESDFTSCKAGLAAVRAALDADTALNTDAHDVFLLGLALVSYAAYEDEIFFAASDMHRSYEARDLAMAQIFLALRTVDYSHDKIVLWAHNYHLSADHTHATEPALVGVTTMGTVLHSALGDQFAPVALVAGSTAINWPGVGTGDVGYGTDADSVEARLRDVGQPFLIVNGNSPALATSATIPMGDLVVNPATNFRAVLYRDSSPGMHALYW
jgi:erythromycin esterase-like protein